MVEVTLSYKSKQFCKGAPGRFVYTGKESGVGGEAEGGWKELCPAYSAEHWSPVTQSLRFGHAP